MQPLLTRLRSFARDVRGNTVMILALCIMPIGVLAGAAIDFSRAEANGRTLQANADSAAIAAARFAMDNPDAKKKDVKQFARKYLRKTFKPNKQKTLKKLKIEFVRDDRISITAESTIQSSMLSLAQVNSLTSKVRSTASMGTPTGLRVVLALDNSDSMDGPKMKALEDAATDFVDQLVDDGGNSYVGVVPFSHHVNVGTAYKNEPWIDVPIATPVSQKSCPTDADATRAAGCTIETSTCTRTEDGVSFETTCSTWSCPPGVVPVSNCSTISRDREWCGAVIQRKPPHHLLDAHYNTHPIDAYLSWEDNTWECNTPILPMTNSKTDLKDYLDDLDAKGDTYIAPGLMWGYRVLSPEAPFTEMSGHTVTKSAIVLMSDGMNSRSFQDFGTGTDHYGSDKNEANSVTLETCDFIKSKDVEIYAIAFQVNDTVTENMLKSCATSYSHYFDAGSFAELKDAFNSVAGAFREIALTE